MSFIKSDQIEVFPLSIDRVYNPDISVYVISYDKFIELYNSATEDSKPKLSTFYLENERLSESQYEALDLTHENYADAFSDISKGDLYTVLNSPKSYFNGRALSEHNLRLISLNTAQEPAYIIDYTYNSTDGYTSIKFMLGGYYFNLSNPDKDPNHLLNKNNLYVKIKLTQSADSAYQRLIGYDETVPGGEGENSYDLFKGLEFSETSFECDADEYSLQLKAGGSIPLSSIGRFTSHAIKNINGGTI